MKSPHLEVKQEWLDQIQEKAILPDLPIIDPHHHLWVSRLLPLAERSVRQDGHGHDRDSKGYG